MKRFVGLLITLIVVYSIYFDLSHGTLPKMEESKPTIAKPISNEAAVYFEKEVKTGDTVLSIIEDHLNKSVPVPISEVVSDFKKLNDGVAPQEIQPGKTYKFPNYIKE